MVALNSCRDADIAPVLSAYCCQQPLLVVVVAVVPVPIHATITRVLAKGARGYVWRWRWARRIAWWKWKLARLMPSCGCGERLLSSFPLYSSTQHAKVQDRAEGVLSESLSFFHPIVSSALLHLLRFTKRRGCMGRRFQLQARAS